MIFRDVPGHPRYEVSAECVVRLKSRPSKVKGRPDIPAKVIKPLPNVATYVLIHGEERTWMKVKDLLALTWPEVEYTPPPKIKRARRAVVRQQKIQRPKPVPGGRVITLAEWIKECHPDA